MVPLTPEVKRIARLEHDRRQAERRFAGRKKVNFCAFAKQNWLAEDGGMVRPDT